MFRRTQDTFKRTKFRLRGCYPLRRTFPGRFVYLVPVTPYRMSYNPKRQASWFEYVPFRSPLLREIAFAFSSSRYLDVSVPGSVFTYPMYSDKDTIPLRMVGFPIRKSSDQSYTFPRSISALVRPSSTPSVKASTVRPF